MPAFADPDLALQAAKAVADLYADATARLLRIVTRRLAQGIDQPGWAERKLAETVALRDEALAEVRRLQGETPAAVRTAIAAGRTAGVGLADRDLADAGIEARFARTSTRTVDALVRATVDQLAATHLQILRTTEDLYRTVISDAAGQTAAGALTRRQAAQTALDRFADQGITGFVDRAGRRWQLDSYAEMATRTAVGRAQVTGALDRFQDRGQDLVIISDAPAECEVCRPWEGTVLSISGTSRGQKVPGFTVAGSIADATSAGLFHANCRHRAGLYVPGLTRPMTHTADPEGDQLRQEQRYLERGVRRWKRREAVALDDAAGGRARAHVRQWQGRLRGHVDANDLKRLRYREQVGRAV